MNYTLDWSQEMLADLTDLWLASNDRSGLTAAEAQINRLLSTDPHTNGNLRSEGLRQIQVGRLVVSYSIDDVNRVVEVLGVHERL